ncbi:MAG TPA: MFS transporter [Blastocatellia bacterium]
MRARRRITRRLIPYLFVLFVVAYLDRVNLGYAGLRMTADTGFSDAVFGFGAGIFFIGYFVLEIPGTVLVEVWSARRWIARIMITWGVLAAAMSLVHTPAQFYSVRFLLGAAEAGFFPGIIVYLGHWFKRRDRGKAIAFFMAAVPISNIIGGPISGLLLQCHWLGLAGWRWLFIIEGAPAVVLGVVTVFYLTDRPRQAHWLSEDERDWIEKELEAERASLSSGNEASRPSSLISNIAHGLRQRDVIFLALAYFFIVTTAYAFNFWLPKIMQRFSGLSDLAISLLATIPFSAGLAMMLLLAWTSDRSGERRWHAAGPMLLASVGLLISAFLTHSNPGLLLAAFSVGAAGMYSFYAGFWSLPGALLTGTPAAAAIGLINSIGNLGGFAGPSVIGYLVKRTGAFLPGLLYLGVSAVTAAICVLQTGKVGSRPAVEPPAGQVPGTPPEVREAKQAPAGE